MDFPWASKKDPRKDDPQFTGDVPVEPTVQSGIAQGEGDPLSDVSDQLGQLERMAHDAREQMARLAQHRGSAESAALGEKLDLLLKKLDNAAREAAPRPAAGAGPDTFVLPLFEGIAKKLDELEQAVKRGAAPAQAAAGPSGVPAAEGLGEFVGQIQLALGRQEESFGNAFRHLYTRMETGFEEIGQFVRPAAPAPAEESAAPPAGMAEWLRVILGDELSSNPALAAECQQLIGGVLHGQYEARALAGQLLVFQSAATEKMPTLLKDIGEAYYRWQPKTRSGGSKFEEALIQWLQRACDSAGIPNTIELVNPGERFDAGRHNSANRGVEITQVLGWVVLRDNGKVYTKALVEVR